MLSDVQHSDGADLRLVALPRYISRMSEQEIPARVQEALNEELSPDEPSAEEHEIRLGLGVRPGDDRNLVRGCDTQTSESRAEKRRVLADIVEDKFDITVWFEQHSTLEYNEISAFHVFYTPAYGGSFDKAFIASKADPARDFVEAALPKIGIHVRRAELRETTFIELRPESASAHEEVAMLRILNRGIHD